MEERKALGSTHTCLDVDRVREMAKTALRSAQGLTVKGLVECGLKKGDLRGYPRMAGCPGMAAICRRLWMAACHPRADVARVSHESAHWLLSNNGAKVGYCTKKAGIFSHLGGSAPMWLALVALKTLC